MFKNQHSQFRCVTQCVAEKDEFTKAFYYRIFILIVLGLDKEKATLEWLLDPRASLGFSFGFFFNYFFWWSRNISWRHISFVTWLHAITKSNSKFSSHGI